MTIVTTKLDRDYRAVNSYELRFSEDDKAMYVEGYAAKYDNETVLYEIDGIEYKEVIRRGAFDTVDLSDVIFRYNHEGKVAARTRNKTLQLFPDDTGLRFVARLDGTEEGRKMYEEIKGEYISEMSFAFRVKDEEYDREKRLRSILSFKKIYDIAPVDIPAYANTSISARSFFEAEAEKEHKAAEAAQLRKKLIIKTML